MNGDRVLWWNELPKKDSRDEKQDPDTILDTLLIVRGFTVDSAQQQRKEYTKRDLDDDSGFVSTLR